MEWFYQEDHPGSDSYTSTASEEKARKRGVKALHSGRGPTEKLKMIGDMVAAKTLQTEVGKIFPLADAAAAQDLSQTRHGRGRILLKVGA